jgi:predicted  nucleic acid-binding Zn-ribbon protein
MAGFQNKSRLLGAERRRGRRHPVAELPDVHASILAGPDVKIVDVSPHGLLVESDIRLIPGAGICLTIKFANESHMLGGRVARVDTTIAGEKVRYRAGIALDGLFAPFDLPVPEPDTPTPSDVAGPEGSETGLGELSESASSPSSIETNAPDFGVLREALGEQPAQDHDVHVIETLKAALRASETARKETDEAHARERDTWGQERRSFEQALEIAARHKDRLSAELTASGERSRTLAKELEDLRGTASAEHALLQGQLQGATGKFEELHRELLALRESHAALSRTLDDERSMIAELLREKDRLLSELEQVSADLNAAAHQRDRAHADLRQSEMERGRLAKQLEVTERWCADQHELIYQLWQQTLRSTALIEGWKSVQWERGTDAPAVESTPDASEPVRRLLDDRRAVETSASEPIRVPGRGTPSVEHAPAAQCPTVVEEGLSIDR